MSMPQDEGGEPGPPQIIVPDHLATGTYAQHVQVHLTPNEFTIDFIKWEPTVPAPGRGYVVARVTLPPVVMEQLPGVFDQAIGLWAAAATPSEAPPEEEA